MSENVKPLLFADYIAPKQERVKISIFATYALTDDEEDDDLILIRRKRRKAARELDEWLKSKKAML